MNQNTTVISFQKPLTNGNSTIVVIPCYNEAERLDQTAFLSFLAETPDTELLFVNDGSKDATLDVLCAMRDAAPDQITVVNLSRNSGQGNRLNGYCRMAASM